MRRSAISVICGLTLTVTLTVTAFSGLVSRDTARILLWQCTFLAQGMPRGNIGTPEHPIYEGTPLDFIPVFLGVSLCVPIYSSLIFVILWVVETGRRRQTQSH